MKLKTVLAKNFKGRDFCLALAPCNIVTGPNFSGKSAVLEAIRVGLLGYEPGLGSSNQKTALLAGDQAEMSVHLGLSGAAGEVVLSHVWKRNEKGAVSYKGEIPKELETPAVLLDAREYFAQTGAERIAYVFRQMHLPEFDFAGLRIELAAVEAIPAKAGAEISARLLAEFDRSRQEAGIRKLTTQVWMAERLEAFKNRLKDVKTQAKLLSGGLVALSRGGAAPKDVATEQAKALETMKTTGATLANLHGRLQGLVSVFGDVASLQTAIGDAQERIAGRSKEAVEDEKARVTAEFVRLDASALKKEIEKARTTYTRLTIERDRLKGDVADMAKTIDAEAKMTQCPFCLSTGEGWKSKMIADNTTQKAALTGKLAEAITAVQKATETGLALKAQQEQAANLEASLTAIGGVLEAICGIDRLQTALDGIRAVQQAIPAAEQAAKEATAEFQKLNEALEARRAWERRKTEAAASETRLVCLGTEQEIIEKMLAILAATQLAAVETAFGGLLEKARRFTDGILRSPLAFHEEQVGRWEGSKFISHLTFSGTEETLAFCGLSVALAQSAPVKVVCMDELGRLTPENKRLVAVRMLELAKEGVLDCFIGVDVSPTAYDGTGIHIIPLV